MSNEVETLEESEETPKKNVVKDVIVNEITILRDISLHFSEQIETAKTSTKEKYFKKKLKINNKKLFGYLMMLDNIVNSEKEETVDE